MSSTSQILLARHLSAAFGLTALALGVAGCQNETQFDDRACMYVEIGEDCPSDERAEKVLEGNQTCETPMREIVVIGEFIESNEVSFGDTGLVAGDPMTECCYEAIYREIKGSGCAIGRPLMHEGRPLTAMVQPRRATHPWIGAQSPSVDSLSADQRDALRQHWLEAALLEHASVGSFSRFALDLLAHGAPPELLAGAHAAAADEVRHAQLCFAMASAYAGENLTPGRLALPEALKIAPDLATLARDAAIEGCIGETIAVMLAAEQLQRSTDPAVRAALAQIVEDEARHAEIAWATLRWALALGGAPVRAALEDVFANAESHVELLAETLCEDLAVPSHGLPSRQALVNATRQGLARVVAPAAAALLA